VYKEDIAARQQLREKEIPVVRQQLFFCLGLALLIVSTGNAEDKSGEAKFEPGKNSQVKVSVGDKIKMDLTMRVVEAQDFYSKKWRTSIVIDGPLKNTSDNERYYDFHIAFFDRANKLVATCSASNKLKPKEDTHCSYGVFRAPPEAISKIASYQIMLYEDTKPLEEKK